MKLVGSAEQQARHALFDASGTITTGGTPQLVLPEHQTRSHLLFVNNSSGNMYVEIGDARAVCTIANGAVTAGGFTITNAGFNYTNPPIVRFLGGGVPQGATNEPQPGRPFGVSTQVGPNAGFLGSAIPYPQWPSPSRPAVAHATLSGNAVNAIVLDDPGSGYIYAPSVQLMHNDLDPNGAAAPALNVGIFVSPGGSIFYNGTTCPTSAVAVWSATTGAAFCCKYMT